MPSDATTAVTPQQSLDQQIDTLLKNSYHAWRTLNIPKINFPSERNMQEDRFIGAYRWNRLRYQALVSFCTQFGPVLEGEYIFSFYYARAGFMGAHTLFFFLTNERMILWDTARKSYWVVPLNSCVSFSRKKGGDFLLERKDGIGNEISLRGCPFAPDQSKITVINAAIAWVNPSQEGSGAGSSATAASADKKPESPLEIQLPDGQVMNFATAEALREPILRGEIPRTSTVKVPPATSTGNAPAGKTAASPKVQTLEAWAKSNQKLRPLYAPIWAMTLKGALWGIIAVAILKTLDTAVLFFRVNPPIALLWLWLGALMGSPKWKRQILMVGVIVLFVSRDSINFGALFSVVSSLFGAWFGVMAFAAVFGAGAGMPIGTVVGAIRAPSAKCAPDRESEGTKPLIWGFLVPAAGFAGAAVLYLRVLMPYFIKNFSEP